MNREEAIARATQQPTPPGKTITTDETFNLFAALVPDSPWSERLLKIRDIFNNLATAATIIVGLDAVKNLEAAMADDPEAANDPEAKQFMAALKLITSAMGGIQTNVVPTPVPGNDFIPTPVAVT